MLSIQSHTVSGYVGNRCSVFTLQVPELCAASFEPPPPTHALICQSRVAKQDV